MPDHRGIAGYAPIAPKPRLERFYGKARSKRARLFDFKMKAFILHDDPILATRVKAPLWRAIQQAGSRLGSKKVFHFDSQNFFTGKHGCPPFTRESNLTETMKKESNTIKRL